MINTAQSFFTDCVQKDAEVKSEVELPGERKSPWQVERICTFILLMVVLIYDVFACLHSLEGAMAILIVQGIAGMVFVWKWWIQRESYQRLESFIMNGLWNVPKVQSVVYAVVCAVMVVMVVVRCVVDYHKCKPVLGLVVICGTCYGMSWHRKEILYKPVVCGFLFQFVFAALLLGWPLGFQAFNWVATQITTVLSYSAYGAAGVFGRMDAIPAIAVLSTVIYFSALVSMLYYLGVMQAFINSMGRCLSILLNASTAESTAAAANVFLGAVEAPLLIRPYLPLMTLAELHCMMTSGFATIAGSVLAIFIACGVSAVELLAASFMSAPAAVAISKFVYPETNKKLVKAKLPPTSIEEREFSIMEAAYNGAQAALGLCAIIIAMLVTFFALLGTFNLWLGYIGTRIGWHNASFETICSYLFYPVAWLMGIPSQDCLQIATLIGYKIFLSEYFAYLELSKMIAQKSLQPQSVSIVTHALCGFSNICCIGLQLGSLGTMIPERKSQLAKMAISALICGNLACFSTACIANIMTTYP